MDSFADHTLWPEGAVERGPLIVVHGRRAYAVARLGEWVTAQEVFAEAADRTVFPTVALALGGSSGRRSDQAG